jgi:anti-sigma factor RsiW
MKPLLKAELSQLLSSYVDGELDDRQTLLVEEIVAKDAEARKELEELRALKNLVAAKKRLPESIGFWTRVSTEIERQKKEEENLLPFPRRYFPLVFGATAVFAIVVGVVLYQQRASVVNFVSRQTERVQKAVGDNVLKGSIMPLFSRVAARRQSRDGVSCERRLRARVYDRRR